jgi:hypothetical protein
MKPTPQISSQRSESFPLTDYRYQSTLSESRAAAKKDTAPRVDRFWKLSTKFHGAEAIRHDATDFVVFSLMGLACTWPIFSVGMAIVHVFCS